MDRLEALRNLVARNPNDLLARYGLAMACAGAGKFEEAVEHFGTLLEGNPDYAAAYFQAGQALEKLGRIEEAKRMYRSGIEVTGRLGNLHARSELQTALDLLG